MTIFTIIYVLLFIIFTLIALAVFQIRMAGIKVKDFWSFIEANEMLDKLYHFSKTADKMSGQEQVIFLMEADKMFHAFEKIPEILWEEEYEKYAKVLSTYKDIKLLRWASN
mgnify:CR=1 FL=1